MNALQKVATDHLMSQPLAKITDQRLAQVAKAVSGTEDGPLYRALALLRAEMPDTVVQDLVTSPIVEKALELVTKPRSRKISAFIRCPHCVKPFETEIEVF